MSYTAIVAPITALRPIPKADRLLAASVLGYSVVVGKDAEVGDLGVLFPTDGLLSDAHCVANGLYPEFDAAGKRVGGGFFDRAKPRVRAQRFRGEKSEGFWEPLTAFHWTGVDTSTMKAGDQFTELNGCVVCSKYETPATRRAAAVGKKINTRRETPYFRKQPDTDQFRFVADTLFTQGSVVYITEKVHGTSQRTGLVLDDAELPLWKRTVNRIVRTDFFPKRSYRLLNGSKNVILEKTTGAGYYGTNDFRYEVIADWAGKLHKGEVVYYEIVGDVAENSPIMPTCPIPDELKDIRKQYGPNMAYRYGCRPGERQVYVYRITRTNEDGIVTELPWSQVSARCSEFGLSPVPSVSTPCVVDMTLTPAHLKSVVEALVEGKSLLDASHIREGVVVRVEAPDGTTRFAKNKSFVFYVLEGVIKLKDDYVDAEESA